MLSRLFRNRETYYVYIATNISKTELVTGISQQRIFADDPGDPSGESFLTDMNGPCIYWLYYERVSDAQKADSRKAQLDLLSLEQKVLYISGTNPEWKFLNTGRS